MRPARRACRIDGVLLLDKPEGPSSNQALQRVKALFGARKAGHAGTLDPMASGLLPIMLGEATKFASYPTDAVKAYEATILLGVRTDSGDITGEVLERHPVDCSADDIDSVLARFRGTILQTPPMHSALKQDGQPLYRMARRGQTVHREPRRVRIDELSLRAMRPGELDVQVVCSKGTYIRVLAEDIGAALGCGGTLKRLRRTRVGAFDVGRAVGLDALELMAPGERLGRLLPVDAPVDHLPRLTLSEIEASRIGRGQPVDFRDAPMANGILRLYADPSGRFLGIGEAANATVRPVRLVAQPEPSRAQPGNT